MNNLFSENLKTEMFHCPNCQKLVSELSDNCPQCLNSISNETKGEILKSERIAKLDSDLKTQKITVLVSSLVGLFGFVQLVSMILEIRNHQVFNFNCLMPFLLIGGFFMSIKGFVKYRELKKEKLNV